MLFLHSLRFSCFCSPAPGCCWGCRDAWEGLLEDIPGQGSCLHTAMLMYHGPRLSRVHVASLTLRLTSTPLQVATRLFQHMFLICCSMESPVVLYHMPCVLASGEVYDMIWSHCNNNKYGGVASSAHNAATYNSLEQPTCTAHILVYHRHILAHIFWFSAATTD